MKITLGKKEFELSPIPLKGLVALEGRLHLLRTQTQSP